MDLFGLESKLGVSSITLVATLLLMILAIMYYADVGVPPGPRGLPYFGYWPFLSNEATHIELQSLTKKYGDIYSLKITGSLFVHLGSIKAVKEAVVTKGDCFAQRMEGFGFMTSVFDEGVPFLKGEPWKILRKFFVQSFREFGLSSTKDFMNGPIQDSMIATVDIFKAKEGKPFNIIPILTSRCSDIMRRMLFNGNEITDKELEDATDAYGRLIHMFIGPRMCVQGEIARRFIFPFWPEYKVAIENHKIMAKILNNVIKKHEETFEEDNVRDIIDAYIKERLIRKSKNDPTAQYFTDKTLISTLVQVVGDGILGIAIFISYFLNSVLDYPEEQEKLFKELEEVVGPDRYPTIEDKSKLTYMNAFIYEVVRTSDFVTLFPSLECTKDTTLKGYKVPKGSIALINFWACHRDPNMFENPNEFMPERYITGPGKQKTELPIIFGVGKRSCAGESFTMMQTFLLLATIVKNFHLKRPEGFDKSAITETNNEIIAIPRKSGN